MVYDIVVRQHGGAIDVERAEGAGSTFNVYLPRGRAAEDGQRADAAAIPGGSETILVVDDEQQIVTLTREVLDGGR